MTMIMTLMTTLLGDVSALVSLIDSRFARCRCVHCGAAGHVVTVDHAHASFLVRSSQPELRLVARSPTLNIF